MNALTAQALRRITGECASPSTSSSYSPTSSCTSAGFHHMHAANAHRNEVCTQPPLYIPSYDGSVGENIESFRGNGSSPIFNMGGLSVTLPRPELARPSLSLLTDVGRMYPGFPTPLSPTISAKDLFPSPAYVIGSRAATPRPLSPAVRSVSPMSIDGSEMCGPSRRCYSHGYDHYASSIDLIDGVIAQDKAYPNSLCLPQSSPRDRLGSPGCLSPKTTMLKSMFANQIIQPPPDPTPYNSKYTSSSYTTSPSIPIANGTETSTPSPLSPTGTILSYISSRPPSSGLLGIRPLSETDVAQYRFWSPCGRRGCAFGCSSLEKGEQAAARRLFRDISEGWEENEGLAEQNQGVVSADEVNKSVWAGRQLVSDWNGFLRGCEREGVATF
jgi:hypothetical protein